MGLSIEVRRGPWIVSIDRDDLGASFIVQPGDDDDGEQFICADVSALPHLLDALMDAAERVSSGRW